MRNLKLAIVIVVALLTAAVFAKNIPSVSNYLTYLSLKWQYRNEKPLYLLPDQTRISGDDGGMRMTLDGWIKFEGDQAYRVDLALMRAVIMVESGFKPHAVTYRDGTIHYGLMQVPPAKENLEEFLPKVGLTKPEDMFDLYHNFDWGTSRLSMYLFFYHGDVHSMLAIYHVGLEEFKRNSITPETQRYIDRVLRYQKCFAEDPKWPATKSPEWCDHH